MDKVKEVEAERHEGQILQRELWLRANKDIKQKRAKRVRKIYMQSVHVKYTLIRSLLKCEYHMK